MARGFDRATTALRRAAPFATLLLAGTLLTGQAAPQKVYATGALPIDPAAYDALPKVLRHRAFLPASTDLSGDFPVPGYQGNEPNCTAWATTYAARSYLIATQLGRRPSQSEAMSPAYVYNRLRPAGSACNMPVYIVDALKVLKQEGSVTFAEFPDNPDTCNVPAPDALKARAAGFRIDDFRAIDHDSSKGKRGPLVLDDIKGTLLRRVPIVFAMPVDQGFRDWTPASGPYTGAGNTSKNYHAMAAVGYDETLKAFRVINSWGADWGDRGYVWVSYDAFQRLVDEAYALEASTASLKKNSESAPDRFENELIGFQCGAVRQHTENGRMVIDGFGGLPQSLDRLRAAASAYQPNMIWRVANHPWPQCEAEMTLAAPMRAGGVSAAITDQAGRPLGGDPVALRQGQYFGVSAAASAARPYLTLIYLQADGSAVPLYRGAPPAAADGSRPITVGTAGSRAMQFEVGSPLGDETIIALASARPLFGPELDGYATERQFLTALREHLVGVPRDDVAATVVRIKTAK